jgi:hypothetical protein
MIFHWNKTGTSLELFSVILHITSQYNHLCCPHTSTNVHLVSWVRHDRTVRLVVGTTSSPLSWLRRLTMLHKNLSPLRFMSHLIVGKCPSATVSGPQSAFRELIALTIFGIRRSAIIACTCPRETTIACWETQQFFIISVVKNSLHDVCFTLTSSSYTAPFSRL